MIQRTLLRQSRALGSCVRSYPRASLARSQFRPAPLLFAPLSRSFTSSRWRGVEEGAKKDEENAAAAAAEAKEEAEAEDPAKVELEAKNKEIIDLKVRRLDPKQSRKLWLICWEYRIDIYDP